VSTNKVPVIGLTTYGRNDENRYHLPAEYVEGVRRAGALSLLIPPGETRIDRLFEEIYGLDEERDSTELRVARRALEAGVPTLAICRGMQILNVELGGTLHEHIPDVFGNQVQHRAPPREPTRHPVQISDKQSKLFEILKQERFDAASWHHQALKNVAEPFRVVAYADDRVIEAVEIPEHPWLVCVQWHPELSAAEDPLQQRLFDQLVAVSSRT
jgi:putative glutamine amidotransferase